MSTTNRTRPICKPVYFTEDEWLSVATKMAESDMPNFSAFCREMLLTGKVKHYDFSVIREISSSLSHISGNINQMMLFHIRFYALVVTHPVLFHKIAYNADSAKKLNFISWQSGFL